MTSSGDMRTASFWRVPPLAIAIMLVAAALVAAAWSTRTTVNNAFTAVRDGQALAVEQSVRADLANLGGPPTADDLAAIVDEHKAEGLRYLAVLGTKGRVDLAAGMPAMDRIGKLAPPEPERPGTYSMPRSRIGRLTGRYVEQEGGRVRIEVRGQFPRAWGLSKGQVWLAMEVEAVQAHELRSAARRTLLVGLVAALVLLVVAGWLVRSELRKAALERKRERERRLASLGEMSAVLAHEIRNPLASLKGNAQLLAASLPEGEKAHAKAGRVVDEAIRLEKLTQDLLAFVRTGELARTDVSPEKIAKEALAALPAATGDTLEVANAKLDVEAAPLTWSLDPARMREVLVNLVDNGLAAGGPVALKIAQRAKHLVIEVRDHGPGVPAADRDKIFEPFHTGKTRGTGLGLAIARRVVELHRGTITVDDAPGGGALFRIEIPQ